MYVGNNSMIRHCICRHFPTSGNKQGYKWIASEMVDLLAVKPFKFKIFRHYFKNLADCKHISPRRTSQITKDDGLHRVFFRGISARKNRQGNLYVEEVTEVRRKRAEFCAREDITFRPEQRNTFSRVVYQSMTTDYTRTSYRKKEGNEIPRQRECTD